MYTHVCNSRNYQSWEEDSKVSLTLTAFFYLYNESDFFHIHIPSSELIKLSLNAESLFSMHALINELNIIIYYYSADYRKHKKINLSPRCHFFLLYNIYLMCLKRFIKLRALLT